MSAETVIDSPGQSTAVASAPSRGETSSGSLTHEDTHSSTSSRRRQPQKRVKLTTNIQFDASRDAFKDIRDLLELFQEHSIPGPLLLRTKSDFSLRVGSGGQGQVRAASTDYLAALDTLSSVKTQQSFIWPSSSAQQQCVAHWKTCVIKQLRSKTRKLENEAASAVREVLSLCRAVNKLKSKRSEYIVRLLGWGICLDALESGDLSRSRLPFLVLERATCDMEQFIATGLHRQESTATKMNMGLEVGIGLFAVHGAKMTHGDVKLSNILIFPDPRKKWSVKLCDFGSAGETTHDGIGQYSGTDTWRPPETFHHTALVDLQLCDIFAYGLVLWSWLLGLTRSPIDDLEGSQVLAQLGQQLYYHRALPDIVREFGEPSDIKWLETESVHGNATSATARVKQARPSFMRAVMLPSFLSQPVDRRIRDFESETVTRILSTLSVALDELPSCRSREPWEFLDPKTLPSRPRPPKPFSGGKVIAGADRANTTDRFPGVKTTRNSRKSLVRYGSRTVQRFVNWLNFQLEAFALTQNGERQRLIVFKQLHRIFFDILGSDSDEIDRVKHSDHLVCEPLSQSSIDLLGKLVSSGHAESAIQRDLRRFWSLLARFDLPRMWQRNDYYLYALARIRSRILDDACWSQLFALKPELGIDIDHKIARLRKTSTGTPLVWAFRNLTALDVPEDEHSDYFTFLDSHLVSDSEKTFRLHLLLEKGFFLGQTFGDTPDSFSIFLRYLTSLSNHIHAIDICQHFRRISSLDGAVDLCKYYYTGLSDSPDAQGLSYQLNTCLHDAVRARSVPVVNYLITTDFERNARDERGMTALDVLNSLYLQPQAHDDITREIYVLLSDSEKPGQGRDDLPLGWKTWQTSDTPAYIETSTALDVSEHPYPITFKKPSTGLYQNNVIALVERKISLTENEPYLFNPLRFLRVRGTVDEELQPAQRARFDEAWCKADAVMLHHYLYEEKPNPEARITRRLGRGGGGLMAIRRQMLGFGPGRLGGDWPADSLSPTPEPSLIGKVLKWHHIETFRKLLASGDLFVIIFGPLSVTARYQHWNTLTQFFLSVLALAGVHARVWHTIDHAAVPARELLYTCGTLLLDLVAALFLSYRLDLRYTYTFIVGSILSSNLLTLGFGALSVGVRFHRAVFNQSGASLLFECTSFPVFATGFTYAMRLHKPTERSESDAMITVSRTIATMSLVIFVALLRFVSISHSHGFDEDDYDMYDYTGDVIQLRNDEVSEDDGPADGLVKTLSYSSLICLVGAVLSDNLVLSIVAIVDEHTVSPAVAITILLPLISKFVIIFKLVNSAWINRLQTVVERTVGLSLGHGLVILPLIVIVGWCRGKSVTYDFTASQVLFLFFQWRITHHVFCDGRSEYLRGLFLVAMYAVFVICTAVSPEI